MNQAEIIEIIENDDSWDTGALGRDEHAVQAVRLTASQQQAIDEAVGLHKTLYKNIPNLIVG